MTRQRRDADKPRGRLQVADDQKTEQDEVEAHSLEERSLEERRTEEGPDVEGHLHMEEQLTDLAMEE
jgi:hypothetical protein